MSINYNTKEDIGILQTAIYELLGDKSIKIKNLDVGFTYDDIEILTPNTEKPLYEDVYNKFLEIKNKKYFSVLRRERNNKLAETDWMANSDVTMSEEWKEYRQSLRDITTQIPVDMELSNINWPIPPS
jgi:hypothetical protein